MLIMGKKSIVILLLISCLFFTGCASSRILLRKGQKELKLEADEGGAIFSLKVVGQAAFRPHNVRIQEINQYKEYKKKKLEIIPLVDTLGYLYLFHMKFPKGTYKLASFYGWIGGLYGNYQYMPCNKIFDVKAGEITYLGRVGLNIYSQGNSWASDTLVIDYYEEDIEAFLSKYPILIGRKINKDLFY